MKKLFETGKLHTDILYAVVATLIIFASFHVFDTFEIIYDWTRDYEELELDEWFLLILALPLPITWLAYRRSLEAAREFKKRLDLERTLSHSHRLESLGTLAGGIAHELNNQLLPILSMSELLRSKLSEDDAAYKKCDLIYSAAVNAKETVGKVLAFSREGNSEAENCNANEVCRDTVELLTITCPPSVNLVVDQKEGLGELNISASDLQSVIVNPVSNAIDALGSRKGGVSIRMEIIDLVEDTRPGELKVGKYLLMTVHDSGPGMPPEIVERISDPFFTTKPVGQGLGLGMSIVNRIAMEAGGCVLVNSKPGAGTTVECYLPSA
jgi:signal transduction histidine kinase